MNADIPKSGRDELEYRITAMLLGELGQAEAEEIRRAIESDPELARTEARLRCTIDLLRKTVAQGEQSLDGVKPRMSEKRRQQLLSVFRKSGSSEERQEPSQVAPWFVRLGLAAVLVGFLGLVGVGMLLPSLAKAKAKAMRASSLPSRQAEQMTPPAEPGQVGGAERAYGRISAERRRQVQKSEKQGAFSHGLELRFPVQPGGAAAAGGRTEARSRIYLPDQSQVAGESVERVGGNELVGGLREKTLQDYKPESADGRSANGDVRMLMRYGLLPKAATEEMGRLVVAHPAPSPVATQPAPTAPARSASVPVTEPPLQQAPQPSPAAIGVVGTAVPTAPAKGVEPNFAAQTADVGVQVTSEHADKLAEGIAQASEVEQRATGGKPVETEPLVVKLKPPAFMGTATSRKLVPHQAAAEGAGKLAVQERPAASPSQAGLTAAAGGMGGFGGAGAYSARHPSVSMTNRSMAADAGAAAGASELMRVGQVAAPADSAKAKYDTLGDLEERIQSVPERYALGAEAKAAVRGKQWAERGGEPVLGDQPTMGFAVGDHDADGRRDIFVDSGRKIFSNSGNGQFVAKDSQAVPEPQPEVQSVENCFSTFSMNISDVSFRLAAAALENGGMPSPASVRSEEFINAFDYRDPEPAPGLPLAFTWERARYPFAHNRDVIRFAVRTAAVGRDAIRPLNLVLLLDSSGSMERADRVLIIREALRVLAQQLRPGDVVSVVTFARTARLWIDALPGRRAGELVERIGNLTPEGGTNLEEALKLAYETAARHFLANGVNRVVLLTDGAANLGDVNPESLRQRVIEQRQRGIALDCFGIGWEGYNDDLLEGLSRNGDGRYGFLNTPEEAATDFAGQLAGALEVAAADVKVQVEFNPARVVGWRQIGYAKHQLTAEQFRDNTVDAAEAAAAESGNALYLLEINHGGEGAIGIVRVRYREPATGLYREIEWPVPYTGIAPVLDQARPSLRLASVAAAFSEWLAFSPYAGEITPDRLLGLLHGVPEAYDLDPRPRKLEWMVRECKRISGK